jgi:anti-sigma B factor antagonist
MTASTSPNGVIQFRVPAAPLRIELIGELDLASQRQLDQLLSQLTGGPARDIVIDLTRVSFLGCAGLEFLTALRERVSQGGCRVILHAPRRAVVRALRITNCERLFTVTGLVNGNGSP